MSLMGVDVGTTGVKAVVFSTDGVLLTSAYAEYDIRRPAPGWAELDSREVWGKCRQVMAQAAAQTHRDPVQAISFSSMGEAMIPVTRDRRILGPSINPNFDLRGQAYLAGLSDSLDRVRLYNINGNTLGVIYSLFPLKWLKEHRSELYRQTDYFLLWGSFLPFMMGAEPHVDYSLANRTLLFDLERADWSDELLGWAGLDRDKLPPPVPSAQVVGRLSQQMAAELGLPAGIPLVSGAHDQCANAVGCGVIAEGLAVLGMGTFVTLTPVFSHRIPAELMLARGLNTEHHAVPGLFVCFLYNLGGALVKWYRDTFAQAEHRRAQEEGRDIYSDLFAEMPEGPSPLLVLPHFGPTGPPEFIVDTRGVIVGLQLDTPRAAVLKAIIEGIAFYLKEILDDLPPTGIRVEELRATGGGARSDAWLQVVSDIMGMPVTRPQVTESSALGAAIMAGVGCGAFGSFEEGVAAMAGLERTFEPDAAQHRRYLDRYAFYRRLWPLMRSFLQDYARGQASDD